MPRIPKRLTREQRQLIVDLSRQGFSNAAIGRQVTCNLETVRRWKPAEQLQGLEKVDLGEKPRQVPQSPYKQPVRTKIKRMAKTGLSSRSIASTLTQKHGISISHTSVCRILHGGRKPLTWLKVGNERSLGGVNKKARVDFCHKWKDSRSNAFDTWVFLDAKDLYRYKYQFGILDYAWQDVCKKKGSEAPPHLGAKPGTPWVFRFYGAVGKDFKSKLHFVPPSPDPKNLKQKKSSETFKSEHFIEMMKNLHEEIQTYTAGRRGGGYKLIMDHAKQHFSKDSRPALDKMGVKVVKDYLAQSWDLNIIENVWGILQGKMCRKNAKSGPNWRKLIEAAWASIELKSINALHAGFQERLKLVHSEDGKWCSHH
jgi:transposase